MELGPPGRTFLSNPVRITYLNIHSFTHSFSLLIEIQNITFISSWVDICYLFLLLGHIIEVTWDVPESSGPGPSDPNCITYAYYSKVDFVKVHLPVLLKCTSSLI